MSEAEILDGLFNALQAIMSVVSLFFAIVSGYIALAYLTFVHDWSKNATLDAT